MFQSHGFEFPADSGQLATNYKRTKHYDQIMTRFPELSAELHPLQSGVFDFFQYVYKSEDAGIYAGEMKSLQNARPQWLTIPASGPGPRPSGSLNRRLKQTRERIPTSYTLTSSARDLVPREKHACVNPLHDAEFQVLR